MFSDKRGSASCHPIFSLSVTCVLYVATLSGSGSRQGEKGQEGQVGKKEEKKEERQEGKERKEGERSHS